LARDAVDRLRRALDAVVRDRDDVADLVDDESDGALARLGAHDDVDVYLWSAGRARSEPEPPSQVDRGDDPSPQVHDAAHLLRRERNARHLLGAEDFLNAEDVDAEAEVLDEERAVGAALHGRRGPGHAAALSSRSVGSVARRTTSRSR